MTLEEAKKVVEQTRSFIGRIYAHEAVPDGPFKAAKLEAILFLMRNWPALETAGVETAQQDRYNS
jgi:hypothetical protein